MSLNEDIKKYFSAAIKPIVGTQAKSTSESSLDDEFDFTSLSSVLGATKEDKKSKIDLAMPSYDSSVVIPLICDIKAKLEKLEKEMYSKAGPKMCEQVEKALSQLESTDLDVATEGVDVMGEIFLAANLPSYEPYLNGKEDKILGLISKQFRNFFIHYWKPESGEVNKETNSKLKNLLEKCTQIGTDLLRDPKELGPVSVKLSEKVSREAIQDFIQSILPFLVKDIQDKETRLASGSHYSNLYAQQKPSDWFQTCIFSLKNSIRYILTPFANIMINSTFTCTAKFASAIVRLLHDYTAEVQLKSAQLTSGSRQQLGLCMNALTGLLEMFLRKDSYGQHCANELPQMLKKMDLSSVLYEMYGLFEFYSAIDNLSVYTDTTSIQHIQSFMARLFKVLGDKSWSHFALIDKELTDSGKSPDNVAFFKMLAERGFVRSSPVSKEEKVVEEEKSEPMANGKWIFKVISTGERDSAIGPNGFLGKLLAANNSFEHIEASAAVPETANPEVATPAVAVSESPKAEAKLNKDEILRQVQMMQEQMAKSQSMINELMSKINKTDDNQSTAK